MPDEIEITYHDHNSTPSGRKNPLVARIEDAFRAGLALEILGVEWLIQSTDLEQTRGDGLTIHVHARRKEA